MDLHDVGVFVLAVEDDVFSVRGDIERLQPCAIAEVRELALRSAGEVEQPEIPRLQAGEIDDTGSVGQEALASLPHGHGWKANRRAIRADALKRGLTADECAGE
jgi:hypothetical protein